MSPSHAIPTDDSMNTGDYAIPFVWSQAEVCALIICACLPSLRVLFAQARHGVTNPSSPHRLRSQKQQSNKSLCLTESLRPTAVEKDGWIQAMQSFPVAGEAQPIFMTSQMIGTTSRVEVMQRRRSSGNDEPDHGGIMVTKEVRRDVSQNPDLPLFEQLSSPSSSSDLA